MSIKKCECGSTEFNVVEVYGYKAFIDSDGSLCCDNGNGGITSIECAKCGKEYNENDFNEIIF